MAVLTLRQWRRVKEISVADMAKALDVHRNTYNKWEENPGKVTIENAHRIADVLDIPIEAIDFLCSETPQKCGEEEKCSEII